MILGLGGPMEKTLLRLWWRVRLGLVRLKGRLLRRDVGERLVQLAWEAALRRDYGQFARAIGWGCLGLERSRRRVGGADLLRRGPNIIG